MSARVVMHELVHDNIQDTENNDKYIHSDRDMRRDGARYEPAPDLHTVISTAVLIMTLNKYRISTVWYLSRATVVERNKDAHVVVYYRAATTSDM